MEPIEKYFSHFNIGAIYNISFFKYIPNIYIPFNCIYGVRKIIYTIFLNLRW